MIHNKRHTFGIIDPSTHKQYKDIISASIIKDIISSKMVHSNNARSYYHRGKMYHLNMDKELKDYLLEHRYADVVISIQDRTDINIAVARIHRGE